MSFLSRKPARPEGRGSDAGRDDEYDDYDGYAHDAYQNEDEGWSPNEYFSPEGIKGRWAGEQPEGRAGGRGRRDNGRGEAGPGYDAYTDNYGGAEYGGGPGYGADEFATGVYDLPDGADEDRSDRSRRRRRDREDRGERTGILRLRRDRGEDIWPDDGISDEDYWASVAADRPLNGTDAALDNIQGAGGGSSRPGADGRPGWTRGQGRAAPTPASAGSSAAPSAAQRDGSAPRLGSPATTSLAPKGTAARWAPASPAAAGRAAAPCLPGREPARSPPGQAPAPPPPSGSPPPGRPPDAAARGQDRLSRDQDRTGSPSPQRGRRFSPTATRPAARQAAGRRTAATGATGPSASSASTPPATPTPAQAAGARARAGPGPPGHSGAPLATRPHPPGHPATARRRDAAAATAHGRPDNAAWQALDHREPDRRDRGRETSGGWPTHAGGGTRARGGAEDDPLTSKAYSRSAQAETDGRSYRAAARRSEAQTKLTEQAETFITSRYEQSSQYQSGHTGDYWQYRDDAPTTITQATAARYPAPGGRRGQGPGSQGPGSQGPGSQGPGSQGSYGPGNQGSGSHGGHQAQPGRSQVSGGHGQGPAHGGQPGQPSRNGGRTPPGLPAAGLPGGQYDAQQPRPSQQRQQPQHRQPSQAQLPAAGLPPAGAAGGGPGGTAAGVPAGTRPTGTGGQNPYDSGVTGSYPYPGQSYAARSTTTGPMQGGADDRYYRPSPADGYGAGGAGQNRTDQGRGGNGYPAAGDRRY